MSIKLGVCGPAKYFQQAMVEVQYYGDGSMALVANGGTERQQVYTVCLHDRPARSGHVWLKDWGANEGVPEALVKAGIVELTGEVWPTGHCEAKEARIVDGLS